jgi:predicted ATPase
VKQDLPTGTVTLLFTDVEGSTRLIEELGEEGYEQALGEHRRKLRKAFGAHAGVEVDTQGDAFFYAFAAARDALAAAAEAQEALAGGPIRVRMGMHTGEARQGSEGYVGREVHRAARIAAASHGGQVLVSAKTEALVDDQLTELGEHRLKDFDQPIPIFQLGSERFPPLKTISNTNLPRPASSFIGRGRELEEVTELLQNGARLVTLSGPGGSGKTRLAIEAAAELVPQFKAGVFWVGLATLRDPGLVPDTIAQTLGAQDGLHEHIAERELLLLLDNLEQVIAAAAELGSLLEACPNLKLLVTSRELLRIRGEIEYAVPPLADQEALELFCARAQIEPDETIAELCRRLDHLPLALELAAARTSVLTPAQILERLAKRLDLLKGGRDAEARQQTLRAAIAWSYDLLTDGEQQLFRRLSVFDGGCTLEAAEDVAGAELDALQSLVDKSLLRFSSKRYWMLETIRGFAGDRLEAAGEAAELGRRHAEEVAHLVRVFAEEASSGEAFATRIEPEYPNLRAALAWAREHRPQLGLSIAAELTPFWELRGLFAEGRRWLGELLKERDGTPPRLALRCLDAAAHLAHRQADYGPARAILEEAQLLALEARDDQALAAIANTLGIVEGLTGDFQRSTSSFEASVAGWRQLGDERELAWVLGNLGRALVEEGKVERAEEALEESLALARKLDSRVVISWSLGILGRVAGARGDLQRAETLLCNALSEIASVGHPWYAAEWLEELAIIAGTGGNAARAGRLWGAATALRDEIRAPLAPAEAKRHESALQKLQEAGDAFTNGVVEGRSLEREAALAYALEPIRSRETHLHAGVSTGGTHPR